MLLLCVSLSFLFFTALIAVVGIATNVFKDAPCKRKVWTEWPHCRTASTYFTFESSLSSDCLAFLLEPAAADEACSRQQKVYLFFHWNIWIARIEYAVPLTNSVICQKEIS